MTRILSISFADDFELDAQISTAIPSSPNHRHPQVAVFNISNVRV